jgi:hypothetical protein
MSLLKTFLVALAAAFLFVACNTPESENASERPWNAQQNWQGGYGIPSNINQGR